MSEIDRQIEAVWRSTSREQPPAAVDDAIRAAARRAVDAGPAKPQAHYWWRAKTHWVPLAAAAVMAVLAVGLIQLTPPEQVNPAMIAEPSASPRPVEQDARKPAAAPTPTAAEAARRDALSSADQLASERAAETATKQLAQLATQQSANTAAEKKRAAAPSPQAPRPSEERQRVASLDAGAEAKSKVEAAGRSASRSAPSEPFPAAQAPAGRSQPSPATATTSSPTLRNEPAAPPLAAPPAVPQSEPFPAAQQGMAASNAAAPAPPPAAMREGVPQVAGKLDTPSAKAQPSQVGLARLTDGSRSKDAAARPVDEWVKLIRRLRAEGKSQEAAKELAAFRAVYKEQADELLPPDLREPKQ